jgi:hydroxymethylpyrimidine/phosphomethylpyrimidine kinase
MSKGRVTVLSIAGYDPSGGAGVLADVKTFEQHRVQSMAVITANTVQTEDQFLSVNWIDEALVMQQLDALLQRYSVDCVKIGLIPSLDFLLKVLAKTGKAKVIWDPVLSASAGVDLSYDLAKVEQVMEKIYLCTPNWMEFSALFPNQQIEDLSAHRVYLKGGHREEKKGWDIFNNKGKLTQLRPKEKHLTAKHGTGCILSSAIAANLAKRYPLHKALLKAKGYTERAMKTNTGLLAYHRT